MPFVEDQALTQRGISAQIQRICYLSSHDRIQMALSMPPPVQANAFVNGNQNAHPNANPNAHQIPQTAVNTTVQPTAQIGSQNVHQGVTNGEFPAPSDLSRHLCQKLIKLAQLSTTMPWSKEKSIQSTLGSCSVVSDSIQNALCMLTPR